MVCRQSRMLAKRVPFAVAIKPERPRSARSPSFALTLMLSTLPCAATHAQETPSASSDQYGSTPTIIVTAERIENSGPVSTTAQLGILGDRDVFSTPFTTSSYTDALIRNQQARVLSDVLDNDSGVRLSTSRYAESEGFTIRGFPVTTVLFAGLAGITDFRTPFIDGIERVEVIEGPSTLINGSSQAVGGTINLVPKRATDTPIRRATLGYDSDLQGEVHVDVGQRWGTNDEWGVRTNLAFRYGDTPVDHQRDRSTELTIGLDYRGERLRLGVDGVYSDRQFLANEAGFGVLPGFAIPRAPKLRSNIFDRSSGFHRYNIMGRISAEYDLSDAVTLFADYGRQHSRERYFGPFEPTIDAADGTADVIVIPYLNRENDTSARVGARARFTTGPIAHQLTVSGESYWDHIHAGFAIEDDLLTNIYRPVPLAPLVPSYPNPPVNFDQPQRTESLVVADVANLAKDRVTLILGARDVRIRLRQTDPSGGGFELGRYSGSKWSPSAALLVKPVARLTLYGNYVQALQQGQTAPVGTVNANQTFPPSIAKQYELGAKYEIARGAGLTLAAFRITQPNGLVDPATNVFSVNGEQRNRGIEFKAFGEVKRGLRLLSGIQWIDGRQVRTADGDGDGRGDLDGRKAIAVPDWQVNVGAELDLMSRLTVTGRLIYTSRQFYDADNSRSIPGWTRIDLGARYTTLVAGKPLTVRAQIENVAGRNYWASTQNQLLAQGTPRTVLLSATKDF